MKKRQQRQRFIIIKGGWVKHKDARSLDDDDDDNDDKNNGKYGQEHKSVQSKTTLTRKKTKMKVKNRKTKKKPK